VSEDAKQRAIDAFERAYRDIERRLRGLSPDGLERPVWTGEGDGWRIRDLVPGLAGWLRVSAEIARRIGAGQRPPEEGTSFRAYLGWEQIPVDEFNGRRFAEWRDRTVDEQFAELSEAHAALMEALRVLPAASVVKADGEPYRWSRQPAMTHLELHGRHIEAAVTPEGAGG
jgi:hypothetical protein